MGQYSWKKKKQTKTTWCALYIQSQYFLFMKPDLKIQRKIYGAFQNKSFSFGVLFYLLYKTRFEKASSFKDFVGFVLTLYV